MASRMEFPICILRPPTRRTGSGLRYVMQKHRCDLVRLGTNWDTCLKRQKLDLGRSTLLRAAGPIAELINLETTKNAHYSTLDCFAFLDRYPCCSSGDYGRAGSTRCERLGSRLRSGRAAISQLGRQRKQSLGRVPDGASQETARLRDGQPQRTIELLEVALVTSGQPVAESVLRA
jgi:hypothetical protein